MSLRAALKVPKYGLFYFRSDRTISIVPLKNVVKVISGDNVSKGSKVLLKYNTQALEAEIIGVNDDSSKLHQLEVDFLNDPANANLFEELTEPTEEPEPDNANLCEELTEPIEEPEPAKANHFEELTEPAEEPAPRKRKRPAKKADGKQAAKGTKQRKKKKEPELATVVSLYYPPPPLAPPSNAPTPPSPELPQPPTPPAATRTLSHSPAPTPTSRVPPQPPTPPAATRTQSPVINRSPQLAHLLSPLGRTVPRSLFGRLPDNHQEVRGYFEQICQQQKECIMYHKLTLERLESYHKITQERFDALIEVLSGPTAEVPLPAAATLITPVAVPAVTPVAVPAVTPVAVPAVTPVAVPAVTQVAVPAVTPVVVSATSPAIHVEDDDLIFRLRSKSTSEKNFAVQLLRHFFEPHELDGRNTRGIGGKLPLNAEKVNKIRNLVFKFFPASGVQEEFLWRDCRKAIDTFLRNRKLSARSS